MDIVPIINKLVSDRVKLLNDIITQNSHMKLFDKQTFDNVFDIIKCFKEFAKLCDSMNGMIQMILANVNNIDKLQGVLSSCDIYLQSFNNEISQMIYLTKTINLRVKPKYFGNDANILFDYNINFSHDNLKDNTNIDTDIAVSSNVCLMKRVYKMYYDYVDKAYDCIESSSD